MKLRSYMRLKICSNQKNTREDFKTFRPGPNMSDEIKNYSIMTIYKKITPLNNLIKDSKVKNFELSPKKYDLSPINYHDSPKKLEISAFRINSSIQTRSRRLLSVDIANNFNRRSAALKKNNGLRKKFNFNEHRNKSAGEKFFLNNRSPKSDENFENLKVHN